MTWIKDQANTAAVSIGIPAPLRRGGIRALSPADQDTIRTATSAEALAALRVGVTASARFWARRRAAAWVYLLDRRIGQLASPGEAASGIANGRLTGIFRGTFAPGLVTVVNHDNTMQAPPT
jgi:hypothetical protein